MTTPWSDTPPKVSGLYLVESREDGNEYAAFFVLGKEWILDGAHHPLDFAKRYRFGPAIPSAGELIDLTAEVERLRAENAALRGRYEKPLLGITLPMRLHPDDDDLPTIPFEVVQKLKCVRAEELDQLRAAAAELAEIKRAWGMAAKDL